MTSKNLVSPGQWMGVGVADSGYEATAQSFENSFRISQIHTAIQQRLGVEAGCCMGGKYRYGNGELFVAFRGAGENLGLAAAGAAPGTPRPEGADGGCRSAGESHLLLGP